jgi:hypothetical protein
VQVEDTQVSSAATVVPLKRESETDDEDDLSDEIACFRIPGYKPHELLQMPGEFSVAHILEQKFGCKLRFLGQVGH